MSHSFGRDERNKDAVDAEVPDLQTGESASRGALMRSEPDSEDHSDGDKRSVGVNRDGADLEEHGMHRAVLTRGAAAARR